MNTLMLIIIASLALSLISFIGGLILFNNKLSNEKISHYLVSFAAGVMLCTAFLDLLPEALEVSNGQNIFLPAFCGILLFFFLEKFVIWFHHHHDAHEPKPAAILVLIGDGFHNLLDGIAIAVTFITNPALGIATTLAIAAHEIPQEMADFSILITSGMKKGKALFFNFLSALTSLVGAFAAYFFLETIENIEGLVLSFTAGMFIYIACSDLIPELHKEFKSEKDWIQVMPFIAGIIISLGLQYTFSH